MAGISNLPAEVRNRVLSQISNPRVAAAFRSTSTAMRNRASDQAFLDRLSKLMSFAWARRNTFEDPDIRVTVDLTDEHGWIDRLLPTNDPEVFENKNGPLTRVQILQKFGMLSHSVESLQVRLWNWNEDLDEVMLEFPAPRFAMPEAEFLT